MCHRTRPAVPNKDRRRVNPIPILVKVAVTAGTGAAWDLISPTRTAANVSGIPGSGRTTVADAAVASFHKVGTVRSCLSLLKFGPLIDWATPGNRAAMTNSGTLNGRERDDNLRAPDEVAFANGAWPGLFHGSADGAIGAGGGLL